MSEDGRRKVLISIIDNIQPSEVAADMILKMFEGTARPSGALGRPLITHFENHLPIATRRAKAPGRRASRRPVPKIDIKPDTYYIMEVAQQATGHSKGNLHKIMNDEPARLRSRVEPVTNRRQILGADIIRLRDERLALIAEGRAAPEDDDDDDDGEPSTPLY